MSEKEALELMAERDDAEEALSQAFYLVTGRSPEWSNSFGFTEALQEIEDSVNVLKARVKQLQHPRPAFVARARAMESSE